MKNTTIEEGNKLIVEFMEFAYLNDFNYPENNEIGWYNSDGICCGKDLKFHSSWDWLMPVVEKIETIRPWKVCIYDKECIIGMKSTTETTKIKAVWLSVVEFIEWYNKQK